MDGPSVSQMSEIAVYIGEDLMLARKWVFLKLRSEDRPQYKNTEYLKTEGFAFLVHRKKKIEVSCRIAGL